MGNNPAKVEPHGLYTEDENGNPTNQVGWIEPAKPEDAAKMLATPMEGDDNRSEWFWLRMQDGTLIFATYPQGETYMEFSDAGVCDFKWE